MRLERGPKYLVSWPGGTRAESRRNAQTEARLVQHAKMRAHAITLYATALHAQRRPLAFFSELMYAFVGSG